MNCPAPTVPSRMGSPSSSRTTSTPPLTRRKTLSAGSPSVKRTCPSAKLLVSIARPFDRRRSITFHRSQPYLSGALALGTAPTALPITPTAIPAMQHRYLLQIVSADVIPNIVPHHIPPHCLWWRPTEGIGVNDRQAMIGKVRRNQTYNVNGKLDCRNGGHFRLPQRNLGSDSQP